jgi:parvulin-like peptidyl-prolyl isomerase
VQVGPASLIVGFLKRAIREPLLHFLVIGVALFGANGLIHGPDRSATGQAITISQGQVNQLVESFFLLAGRLPSRVELQALVDDYITEEMDYREAIAMGLDADDMIVRRRMRQKLEFLVEDADASEEPTEVQLQSWLTENADRYRLPERRAIRQVLASADKRGEGVRAEAEALLAKLKAGADPAKLGDPSMLPAAMPLTTEEGAANQFGPDFAATVFSHRGEGWFGPVTSPFGQHLVLVMEVESGRAATLEDVHDRVRSDWIETRRDNARDDAQARMRARYQIRVEWPEQYKGLPAVPDPAPRTKKAPPEVGE